MSRQIYQKSGLIAALIIAAVSLPIGIIGFTREPKVTENYYDENYYNYYNQTYYYGNNATTVTIKASYHSFPYKNWEAVAFDYSKGDKMIVVWRCGGPPIDVFFMSKENFQLFIDGSNFNTVLSVINTTGGFLEFEIIVPNLYFTVFYANYTDSPFEYQVTQYCI